ncbi:hypothetical protein BH11CYA1_BH11CYA1_30890 [soil metagenome]
MNLSVSAKNASQSAATDDEMAAITAAVQAFLDDEEHSAPADNNLSESPWAVAARLEAVGGANSNLKSKPWGSVFALSLGLASACFICQWAPAAMASEDADYGSIREASEVADLPQIASNNRSSNKTRLPRPDVTKAADKQIRVCLSASVQKVDLDFPDGGSVYTVADGTLVGKIAPQSSWSLNLAGASPTARTIAFVAKSARDKIYSASRVSKVAFIPSTGSFFGTNNDANQLVLPLAVPLKKVVTANSPNSSDYSDSSNTSNTSITSAPTIDASQGYIAVPDQAVSQSDERLAGSSSSVALVGVNGKLYRGAVVLKPCSKTDTNGITSTSGITLVNILDLEDYLLSVVPSEVPSLWPKEVLKAQAIAARSYAVANLGKHKVDGYDVKATVDDQVYRGVIAESAETNAAVAETAGLVLKNNNKVISAFFHSTSGGSTEVSENVWGKPLPYLKSVVDYDDAAPKFTWRKTITSQALGKALFGSTPDSQTLLGVLVIGRHPGDSQRVKDVLVIGQNSARLIAGTELRRLFNLPSTQFSLFQSDSSYIFSGRGYGHGLGLSQWGAKALADNGYNAEQILSYYYKDVTIEPLAQEGAI